MDSGEVKPKRKVHWVPLESNPDMLSKMIHKFGVPEDTVFSDCFGFDPELLAMVPQPCLAVLMLFPLADWAERKAAMEAEKKAIEEAGGQTVSDNVFFMRQNIGNACGTIAVVHSVINNLEREGCKDPHITVPGESFLRGFIEKSKDKDPEERGTMLGEDMSIAEASEEVATDESVASTVAPGATDRTNYHFVCFIHKDESLYELDGLKEFPINHGDCKADELLYKATAKIKSNWVDKSGGSMMFSVMTLGPKPSW